jgi:hypothetical protein
MKNRDKEGKAKNHWHRYKSRPRSPQCLRLSYKDKYQRQSYKHPERVADPPCDPISYQISRRHYAQCPQTNERQCSADQTNNRRKQEKKQKVPQVVKERWVADKLAQQSSAGSCLYCRRKCDNKRGIDANNIELVLYRITDPNIEQERT